MPGQTSVENGKRGGRPIGSRNRRTIEAEAKRELVFRMVSRKLRPMIEAQIDRAIGVKFLVVRQKSTGKFLRRVGATDPKVYDPDLETVEIYEAEPSTQAASDLLNRTLGKPIEQIEMQVSGEVAVIESRLTAARARMAARRAAPPADDKKADA